MASGDDRRAGGEGVGDDDFAVDDGVTDVGEELFMGDFSGEMGQGVSNAFGLNDVEVKGVLGGVVDEVDVDLAVILGVPAG